MMMTQIRKRLLIGITALGLAAGSFGALAGRPDGMPQTGAPAMPSGEHARSPEQMKERFAKRQAELHDKLKLSPAQEPAWNTFAGRMNPGERPARPDRAEIEKLSAPERMERMLSMMQDGEKRMAERLAAVKQFYAVLTPEQQKTFNEQFGPGRHHGQHRRHRDRQPS
jgi:Spy/CpxP family protein refolding chaperone